MIIHRKKRADLFGECDECRTEQKNKAKYVNQIQCLHMSLNLCNKCFKELRRQIKLTKWRS